MKPVPHSKQLVVLQEMQEGYKFEQLLQVGGFPIRILSLGQESRQEVLSSDSTFEREGTFGFSQEVHEASPEEHIEQLGTWH